MGKRYRGSLTVEASMLIPIIVFIIVAQLYILYFWHDKVMMQSYAYRIAENILLERDDESTQLLMMEMDDISTENTPVLTDLMDLIGCRRRVSVSIKAIMNVGIAGSIPFLGEKLKTQFLSEAVSVDYVQDRLRSIFMHRVRENN